MCVFLVVAREDSAVARPEVDRWKYGSMEKKHKKEVAVKSRVLDVLAFHIGPGATTGNDDLQWIDHEKENFAKS